MDWLKQLLSPAVPGARPVRLDASHGGDVAALQQAGGFARGWDAGECAALLADPTILADGLRVARARRLCGFVISRKAADEAEIVSIVVAPARRGAGLGQALLAGHLGRLAAAGIRQVFLEVEEGNQTALALYGRLGFAEIGRRKGYYPKPDGSRAAAVTMRRDLA